MQVIYVSVDYFINLEKKYFVDIFEDIGELMLCTSTCLYINLIGIKNKPVLFKIF